MTKPRDNFALALRIFGVIIFAFGFRQLIDIFLGYLNYIPEFDSTFRYYIIISLSEIAIGLYLIRRGAPLIVDYAYPDDDVESVEEIEAETDILPETKKNESDVFNDAETRTR